MSKSQQDLMAMLLELASAISDLRVTVAKMANQSGHFPLVEQQIDDVGKSLQTFLEKAREWEPDNG